MKIRLPYLMAITLVVIGVVYGTSSQGLNASPTTSVTTFANQRFDLGTDGNARLVSFYSPDCAFCRRDTSTLNALHEHYLDQNVNVIAVAMAYDTVDKIAEFSQKNNVAYHLAHDTDGSIASAFPSVRFTPTTFLIDKTGKIVWRHTGKMNAQEVRQQVSAAAR